MELNTLSVMEVIRIHDLLATEFELTPNPIYPPGIKDNNMLESAVNRQHTSFDNINKYTNPIENAATLTFGLCCNHPFHNGNKRTALVACLAHLEKNKLIIRGMTHKELEQMILRIATHTLVDTLSLKLKNICQQNAHDSQITAISLYMQPYISSIKRGERPISYRRLEEILKRYGYLLKNRDARHVEVFKRIERKRLFSSKLDIHEQKITTITYHGPSETVGWDTIKHVRKECELREEDGCDSNSFYNDADIIDGFINNYRKILYRLANK